MTGSPPSQLIRDLLESSLGESLLTPGQALFERADLILAGFDEFVDVQFAVFEGFRAGLAGEVARVADLGALVETRAFGWMRFGGGGGVFGRVFALVGLLAWFWWGRRAFGWHGGPCAGVGGCCEFCVVDYSMRRRGCLMLDGMLVGKVAEMFDVQLPRIFVQ